MNQDKQDKQKQDQHNQDKQNSRQDRGAGKNEAAEMKAQDDPRSKKNLAIILAGGTGSRIDESLPKQFFLLDGRPILRYTIEKFEHFPLIDDIFLVTNGEFIRQTEEVVRDGGFRKVRKILKGGETRQDSSRIGVTAAKPGEYENVFIHDAARPFVSPKVLSRLLEALETYSAVNLGIPSPDTIVEVDENGFTRSVPDRRYLRRVQTPQAFKLDLIRKAHLLALEKQVIKATDDCSLILRLDLAPIYVVDGSNLNIKITYPIDLHLAQKVVELECLSPEESPPKKA